MSRASLASALPVFAGVSVFWVAHVARNGMLASDARVYWAGGRAVIEGQDPWGAAHGAWHFGSFPPTALLFAPAGLLPEPVFLLAWMALTVAAAWYIVARLELPRAWLLFPPMVYAVLLGNPIVVSMALVIAGRGALGALVRPQHALVVVVRRPWALVPLALAGVVSLVVFPYWPGEAAAISARYLTESGGAVNAWGSWWMLPVGSVLLALGVRDRELAAWLIPAALLPAAGWYAAMAMMPARRAGTGLLAAVPVPGLFVVAAVLEASLRLLDRVRPDAVFVRGRGRGVEPPVREPVAP